MVEDNVEMLGRIATAAAESPGAASQVQAPPSRECLVQPFPSLHSPTPRLVSAGKIRAVELNLACPNIPGKPTVALDFEQMASVLERVLAHPGFAASGLPLGIKLAPYFDGPHFDQAAAIINRHAGRIAYVVTMNTIGNCLTVDSKTESATIAPKGGFGGLAGGFAKPIALANVAQLRKRLVDEIDIVGVGGVASGDDAFQLILCGAKAVQVATTHWLEGPQCFERIARELSLIMVRKGYTSLEQFRGKLKPYDKNNKPKEPKEERGADGMELPVWVFVSVPILMLVSILIGLLLLGRK
jgi:dihydroorotate dehydrogenase (fumarate)